MTLELNFGESEKFESENRNVETDLRCSVFDIQCSILVY
jgi:hypothetical protein